MQTLVDYSQDEDIEVLGDQLYFIVGGDKRDADQTRQLVQSIMELHDQLYENASLSTPLVKSIAS
jgi:hypothetical protein